MQSIEVHPAPREQPDRATDTGPPAGDRDPTAADSKLDRRQDDLMASESTDGRPPTHGQRRTGWRLIAIVLPLLVIGAASWALIRGAGPGTVAGFGLVFLVLLLIGGWPVWIAGFRRGGEESDAKAQAATQLQPPGGNQPPPPG